jgi:hypothetical protein
MMMMMMMMMIYYYYYYSCIFANCTEHGPARARSLTSRIPCIALSGDPSLALRPDRLTNPGKCISLTAPNSK